MAEQWVPRIGDIIKKGNQTAVIRALSPYNNSATLYVTDPTGSYHTSTLELQEWKLDNSSCTSPEPLSLTSVEEITKPERYNKKGKLECWDVILDQEMDFLEGNILKYVWRYKEKNGVADLKKARVYLDKLISQVEKNGK
jgi:hypothetical protein